MFSRPTITLVEIKNEGLYTWAAYCEYRLQMSTGDFHTHEITVRTCDADLEYTDLDDETGEFVLMNEVI